MIFEKAFGIYNTFKNHGWGKNGKRKKRKVNRKREAQRASHISPRISLNFFTKITMLTTYIREIMKYSQRMEKGIFSGRVKLIYGEIYAPERYGKINMVRPW